MLEALRLWLNGSREYWAGVILYSQCNPDIRLITLIKKGKTDFTNKKLYEELLAECNRLKSLQDVITENGESAHTATTEGSVESRMGYLAPTVRTETKAHIVQPPKEPVNPTLYEACKLKADNQYKEAMNLRAVLFGEATVQGYEDVNRPDLVQKRSKKAVDVVVLFNRASKLYEIADYVRLHGRLPNEEAEHDEATEMDAVPDELVKSTLDNLRKNFNKMKKREQTPERVALLQKHEANIKKLEARWHLLKFEAN
jgi:hypothetical protein